MVKNLFKGGKEWMLKNRLKMLVAMGVCGLVLVGALYLVSEFLLVCFAVGNRIDVVEKFLASLYVIFLGLPTAIMLWFFRTHDTSEQIQKTKENTNASILLGAQEMLFDNNSDGPTSAKNVAGIALLINLRQQGLHQSTIDLATRTANLVGADLSNVDLRGANLSDADFNGANLSNSDLRGTDLQRAKYIWDAFPNPLDKKTVFTDALYSDETQFPEDIDRDPEKYGMKKID